MKAMEKEAEERRERMLRDIAEAEKAEKLRQEELLKAQPSIPAKYVPPRGGAGGIRDFERGSSGRPPATDRDRNINDWGRVPSARVEMASGGTPWRGGRGGNDAAKNGGGRDPRESEVVRESNRDGDRDVGRFPTRDGDGRDARDVRDSGLRSRDSGRDFGPRDGSGRDVREGGGRDNFVSRDGGRDRERTKDNKDTEDQWKR